MANQPPGQRWAILIVWLVVLAASAPLALQQTGRLSGGGWDLPGSSDVRASAALQDVPGQQGDPVGVLIEAPSTQQAQHRLADVVAAVARRSEVVTAGRPISLEGGRALLLNLRYIGVPGNLYNDVTVLRADLVSNQGGVSTRLVGSGAIWSNFQQVSKSELTTAELVGFPLMAIILLLAFGTLLAAFLPVAIGVVAVVCTGAAIYLLAGPFEISIYVTNIASMIGIGVAVDYSLFIVSDYRTRLAAGGSSHEALAAAMRSAGTAIVYSGATVVVSLSSLFLVNLDAVRSMAVGAVLVVGVAVLATAGLLPALIALGGPWIERLKVRGPTRRRGLSHRPFWEEWVRRVMGHPILFLLGGVVVLISLAAPLGSIQTRNGALEQLPVNAEVRQATARLTQLAGPGITGIMNVVVPTQGGASRVVQESAALNAVARVYPPQAIGSHGFLVQVVPAVDPESQAARQLFRKLESLAGPGGAVGGTTAFEVAMDQAIFGGLWRIAAYILAFSYIVLLLLLRSVLLPLKAVVMNVLSVAAAYGVLVMVFQWGWLNWTGYRAPGYIDSIVPMLLLAAVFGLSMDYEVFLLTRIRERYLAGDDNASAVGRGLAASARTITAAALVMVSVFASFTIAGATSLRELGAGLAVAVLLDATIVRLVIVPATMCLLGDWNWWAPGVSVRRAVTSS